ncbi:uncharacterized protein LOC126903170 isoform X1 [Daktulosphaira vitifoliae]|uniref:uncharacterized protein LOC126903170 isoform X1 n=1 Tax=Daktulosphaira vitifoliae TaxID=58002 RepID=UPI0021AA2F89|nr:uncharacterized protein LOC126903170 isoform X1 [Daktulosphaira vitifoliae]
MNRNNINKENVRLCHQFSTPQTIGKNVTITSVSKKSDVLSYLQNKNGIDVCRIIKPELSKKFSKEVTITPIENKESNEVISLLKKLPAISFAIIKHEPEFKVPQTPPLLSSTSRTPVKCVRSKKPKELQNRSLSSENNFKQPLPPDNKKIVVTPKPLRERNVPSSSLQKCRTLSFPLQGNILHQQQTKQRNSPSTSVPNIKTPKSAPKKRTPNQQVKTKQMQKNVDDKTQKKCETSEISLEKIPSTLPDNKENVPRTSSPNSLFTTIGKNDTTEPSVNNSYTLMDLSVDGKINITPAAAPSWDLDNSSVPEYDKFVMGIGDTTPSPCSSSTDYGTTSTMSELLPDMVEPENRSTPSSQFWYEDIAKSLSQNSVEFPVNGYLNENDIKTTAADDAQTLQKIRNRFCDLTNTVLCNNELWKDKKRVAQQEESFKKSKLE